MSIPSAEDERQLPLLSNRFLYRVTGTIAVVAAFTALISLAGHWLGRELSAVGHTDSQETVSIAIGRDRLAIPENEIRFARQRVSGAADSVDLYLSWPAMKGYTTASAQTFTNIEKSNNLIFLQISQATMSRDMSGRLEPIYRQLFEGEPQAGPNGLTLHHFKQASGYGNEVMLTFAMANQADYAVRCILPNDPAAATSGDCQRDIAIGQDLSILYRFSSARLQDWQALDAAVRSHVTALLARK
ncbi:hypothetical protein [Rhizobium sp. PAMB 3182]